MGAYLSQPITEKESTDGEDGKFKYGTTAMQGWRTNMEDAHSTVLGLDENTAFFGVFDGHGGKEVALYCSRHLHEEFKKNQAYKEGDLKQALIDSFLAMDVNMVHESGREELTELMGRGGAKEGVSDLNAKMRAAILARARQGADMDDLLDGDDEEERPWEGPQAGSTSVVAVVRGDQLIVANAGDSRAVLSRQGQAVPLSRDHKPMDEDERERIQKAGGFVQEGRVNGSLALSRAIGDLEYKQGKSLSPAEQIVTAHPELTEHTLSEGDEFIVLACDGIWDVMTSQRCIDFVRERLNASKPLSKICEELCDECIAPDTKGSGIGCDNMSVVIVVLKHLCYTTGGDGTQQLRPRQVTIPDPGNPDS